MATGIPATGLKIGEVAKLSGLSTSTIRYYERHGLLPTPARVSGQRCYEANILQQIALIQAGKRFGFSLEEIKSLIDAASTKTIPSAYWRYMAEAKLHEVETQMRQLTMIQTLLIKGSDCHCTALEQCLNMLDS